MKTNLILRDLTLAFTFVMIINVSAYAEVMAPQPIQSGDATYISGGVGSDEKKVMQAIAQDYNLRITNADKDGHFTAGTDLMITGKKDVKIISATNTGPLFYARLAAGRYKITATHRGVEEVRNIQVVGDKSVNVYLRWQPQQSE